MDRRSFLIASGVSSLATIAVPAMAEPASAAQEPRSLRIKAGFLSIGLDQAGRVVSLVDLRNGTDYAAAGRSVPLVSVVLGDGKQEAATQVQVSRRDPRVLVFSSAKVTVEVKVVKYATYSTLEVVRLDAAPGTDVQTLLWGPLSTSVTQKVGEDVGVVGNSRFAFGIIPLNDKTVGAWPKEFDSLGFGADVESLPYGHAGTQNGRSAGAKTSWGSILRAYTYDYSKVRIREGEIPIGPLSGPEGKILGSKLAVFGSAPDLVLTVLSQVAQGEDLPYPTINGQWQKVAQATRQPFLTLHDLSTGKPRLRRKFRPAGRDQERLLRAGRRRPVEVNRPLRVQQQLRRFGRRRDPDGGNRRRERGAGRRAHTVQFHRPQRPLHCSATG